MAIFRHFNTLISKLGANGLEIYQGTIETSYGGMGVKLGNGVIDIWRAGTTVGKISGSYYAGLSNTLELYGGHNVLVTSRDRSIKYSLEDPNLYQQFHGHAFTGNVKLNNDLIAFGKTFTKVKAGNTLTSSDYVMVAN